MYGYMRVEAEQADHEVAAAEQGLRAYAEAEGHALVGIRHEVVDGSLAELAGLVREIAQEGGGPVVVPSRAHFGRGEALRASVSAWVEAVTGSEPHEVEP